MKPSLLIKKGFRPIELRLAAIQVYEMFLDLFPGLFSGSKNDKYLSAVRKSLEKKQWKRLSHGLTQAVKMAREKFEKKPGSISPNIRSGWTAFARKIALFERQRKQLASGFAFSFVEVCLNLTCSQLCSIQYDLFYLFFSLRRKS